MEELPLFDYFTFQYGLLCVGGKVKFPLLHFSYSVFWVNHVRFSSKSSVKTLYYLYISDPFW